MQGPSHVGFALAGAVTMNSVISWLFPHPLPGVAESVIHALGAPWGYPAFVQWFHAHAPINLKSPGFDALAHKLTFYVMLAMSARLPDQLEQRGENQPPIKHRGFTHSCFLIFLLLLFSGGLCTVLTSLLAARHLMLTDFWAKELSAFLLAFVFAFILHIVADSMTTRGVKVMWPDTTYYGLSLFSNGTPGEYLVLWSSIFLTGALVALGIFGF